MRINKLVLNNFFRYYGKQEIIFSTNEKKNVTVLRGENGAGKTTLLNAFYWVMYGDVLKPLTIENMLNYRVAEEIQNNQITESYVEMEFEDRDIVYTIKRGQEFRKENNKIIGEKNIKPNITYKENGTGNYKNITDKDFMDGIIPKRLRHLFFFDGERINRLAQVDGKEEVKKAILDILGLTAIDNSKKDLDIIRNEYIKELSNNSSDDEKKYGKELDSNEKELEELEELLKKRKNEAIECQAEIDKCTKYLERSNSEMVKARQEELKILEKDINSFDKDLENIKIDIRNHISKNLKVAIISDYFKDIAGYLEDKREKGELPSDIKIQFIDDILDRGRCICGCDLQKGTVQYETVEKLKTVAGRSELDDAYSKITSYIKYVNNQDDFFEVLDSLNKREVEIYNRIDEAKNRKENISKELRNCDDEKIRYNENQRISFSKELNEINKKIGITENEIKIITNNIEKIRNKIRLCEVNNSKTKQMKNRIDQIEKLIDLNDEIKESFVETTREELDAKIKEVFAKITRKDYRIPMLTKDFELKIVSNLKGEQKEESQVLSTGEGQITSLSFIGSLVEYAREKTKQEFLSDFSGGDYPIVMDSPFGNLDATHTSNVAANIGKLASQVIIVVSDKQWSKEVEDNIKSQVGKMYKMYDINDINKDVLETTVIEEEMYIG